MSKYKETLPICDELIWLELQTSFGTSKRRGDCKNLNNTSDSKIIVAHKNDSIFVVIGSQKTIKPCV